MEPLKTDGIVLKRTFVGEKDAIIKILTKEKGFVSASVKGIKNMKSKLKAGSSVFSYSEFVLTPSKNRYIVTQSTPKECFYGLSSNIERLSYATYFADLTSALFGEEEDAKEVLPLLLNALYLIANTDKSARLVKCVFTLKLLAIAGFLPELDACVACGEKNGLCFFSPSQGGAVCKGCLASNDAVILTEDTISAMRYAKGADNKKAFSFALSKSGIDEFELATDAMAEYVLMRRLPSLTYLKQIAGNS